MTQVIEDLNSYERSSDFYGELNLVLTVKSFDLQAIRKRYLASKNNKSGKAGSVERRKAALGGLVACTISNGEVTQEEVLAKVKEPRGIGTSGDRLAVSSENEVFILGDTLQSIVNPWFSYIHTVDFDPSGERLLVSSSGLDCIFEYDVNSLQMEYEWFAWEHGFAMGVDPESGEEVRLSRYPIDGERVLVIEDPETQVLPTAMRAAFINSVEYDRDDPSFMLATFFHEGRVYRIDKASGASEPVISGMKNPHGGGRLETSFYATSTGQGKVIIVDEDNETVYDFSNLPGKPSELGEMEWLQNSKFAGDIIITIDSNRTSFVIIDRKRKLIDIVPYNDNWAVQDMVLMSLEEETRAQLRSLSLEEE